MPAWVRVSLAVFCVVALPVLAAAKTRPGASARPLVLHTQVLQGGRTTQAQPFKPLQIIAQPHKAEGAKTPSADVTKPAPAATATATPEYNPLKHRHLAMPVAPSGELAF